MYWNISYSCVEGGICIISVADSRTTNHSTLILLSLLSLVLSTYGYSSAMFSLGFSWQRIVSFCCQLVNTPQLRERRLQLLLLCDVMAHTYAAGAT
jgi:hypothetical protein